MHVDTRSANAGKRGFADVARTTQLHSEAFAGRPGIMAGCMQPTITAPHRWHPCRPCFAAGRWLQRALPLLLWLPCCTGHTPLSRRLGLVADGAPGPAVPAGCDELWFEQALDHFRWGGPHAVEWHSAIHLSQHDLLCLQRSRLLPLPPPSAGGAPCESSRRSSSATFCAWAPGSQGPPSSSMQARISTPPPPT